MCVRVRLAHSCMHACSYRRNNSGTTEAMKLDVYFLDNRITLPTKFAYDSSVLGYAGNFRCNLTTRMVESCTVRVMFNSQIGERVDRRRNDCSVDRDEKKRSNPDVKF